MRAVSDLFQAEAGSFQETMMAIRGSVGFRIPIYQRPYDWDNVHLQRLIQDCFSGFYRTVQSRDDEYTFLGTIILARDESQEPTFEGTSFTVVDGQQRLTSLAILSTILFKYIKEYQSEFEILSSDTREWLRAETEYQLGNLYRCVMGPRPTFGSGGIPFPRIVRTTDTRGNTDRNSEYRSVAASLFMNFDNYAKDRVAEFDNVVGERLTTEEQHLYKNLRFLDSAVSKYVYEGSTADAESGEDIDLDVVTNDLFRNPGFRELFDRLHVLVSQSLRDRAMNELASNAQSAGIVRLLAFASYLAKSVILTKVIARAEKNAFDIFDALNTTGEPLTALETLKPVVVEFEESQTGYRNSVSERHWNIIDETVSNAHVNADRRQLETRQLLTSFALLYNGRKLPNSLAVQRDYLRNLMRGFPRHRPEVSRGFVGLLAQLADYRSKVWRQDNTEMTSSEDFGSIYAPSAKLCLMLIEQMNTSLAIPVLARYWIAGRSGNRPYREFESVVKAVTAFLVLRRAATGNTANIDADFRALMMNSPRGGGRPLCVVSGRDENPLWEVDELRSELQNFLEVNVGVIDRSSWLCKAETVEQWRFSRPLTRFLYFAAAHNARPQDANPGLLTRRGINPSSELDVLNPTTWKVGRYATLEHIAPVSPTLTGWDQRIYDDSIVNLLGNLIPLPSTANSLIGNATWDKKKLFYRALMARTESEREREIQYAESMGVRFSNRIKSLLDSEERLHVLDSLEGVQDWTADLVLERTRNILMLAWDQVAPWLYSTDD